ncbi:MAG: GxxExxY protein [Bacteroidetes bacterium]|jgi:GxxExxY protein|nr:GxxExxY protein [Bacteroidota bacterium]
MEPDAKVDHWAREVIGAAIEIHRILGPGFRESVYEEAFAYELRLRSIPYQRRLRIPILYKEIAAGFGRLDFLVDGCLVVDTKASEGLHPLYTSQVISYLKAMDLHLGLLINFNETLLKNGVRRVVRT